MKLINIAGVLAFAATSAQAASIAEDNFTYADGALTGLNGGTGFSGAWTAAFGTGNQVVSGVVESQGSGGNFRGLDSAFGTSGEIWVSFDFGKTVGTANSFAGLSFFEGGSERAIIGDGQNNNVNWGIAGSGASAYSSVVQQGFKTGVARITLGTGATSVLDLWVGADAVASVNISGAAMASLSGLTLAGVDTLRLAAGNDESSYDNLILGNTFSDVGAIPEPSSYAMLAGLATLGLTMVRRRRLS